MGDNLILTIMKTYAPLFLVLALAFSVSSHAQRRNRNLENSKMANAQLLADKLSSEDGLAVVSYHVEERINMAFGSSITTYDVSNINLVATNDLGQNNVRIVTPKYGKAKLLTVAISQPLQPRVAFVKPTVQPMKIDIPAPRDTKEKYANIDKVSTYERILERGYKSEDMFRRVADRRFFAGDLAIAARWYNGLFSMTTNLDPVYYYRYAESLKAIGELEKSKQMMKIFESKK